jgi:chromate transporter
MNPALKEIALVFLKLGSIGFGGPAATIAMMEDEVVRRRHWVSREDFLDLMAAANVIPGPNSTELAIYLGHRRGGRAGLILAGACFILPAAFIVISIAWAYRRFGLLPQVNYILQGIKPVVLAVIFQALWGLTRNALKTKLLGVICLVGAVLGLAGVNELMILFLGGVAVALTAYLRNHISKRQSVTRSFHGMMLLFASKLAMATAYVATPFSILSLFLFFLKVGSVLYGSGYVLLAFLQSDLVANWHWLTQNQLLDAIAVGQMTPGPLFTTATFVGYLLGGVSGAFWATVGIFLPAFIFVALSGSIVLRIRRSAVASSFLDGVVVTSLSLMAVVTYQISRAALVDAVSFVLLGVSMLLLIRYRVNSAWLVLGGAVVGFLYGWIF